MNVSINFFFFSFYLKVHMVCAARISIIGITKIVCTMNSHAQLCSWFECRPFVSYEYPACIKAYFLLFCLIGINNLKKFSQLKGLLSNTEKRCMYDRTSSFIPRAEPCIFLLVARFYVNPYYIMPFLRNRSTIQCSSCLWSNLCIKMLFIDK